MDIVFTQNPNLGFYDREKMIDKIRRAQAGENVPGVTLFDGSKMVDLVKPKPDVDEASSPSLLTIGLFGILAAVIFTKRKKKSDS